MKIGYRTTATVVALGVVWATAAPVSVAQDVAQSPPDITPTTASPSGEPPSDELAALRPAVEQYAAEYRLSFDDAVQELQTQAELTQYADSVRHGRGFAGFRVERTSEGLQGAIALTADSPVPLDGDLPLRRVPARAAAGDQAAFSESLTPELKLVAPTVVATTYDAFEDSITIWASPPGDDDPADAVDQSELAERIRQLLGSSFDGVNIQFETAMTGELAHGGRRAYIDGGVLWFHWSSGECTTSFGVSKLISGDWKYGYLIAGHCKAVGGDGWIVKKGANEYPVQQYHNQNIGFYKDRIVFEAGGASWLTKVAPATHQDMSSAPTHLYQGVFYCHYGNISNEQKCGELASVNWVITAYNWTFYTFRAANGVTCTDGDSGGPVWQPNYPSVSIPAGNIISAVSASNNRCLYLSLDDQLAGSGWALL